MSNYSLTPTKKYGSICTSVTYNLQRTQHAPCAGVFITYYHTKFHMSVSSKSLVIATQLNAKGISQEHQVNLTLFKVSSTSVAHCVMLFGTLHCVKYYNNILTNNLGCNHSEKLNSFLYHVGRGPRWHIG